MYKLVYLGLTSINGTLSQSSLLDKICKKKNPDLLRIKREATIKNNDRVSICNTSFEY
jgi:hypothetical protein